MFLFSDSPVWLRCDSVGLIVIVFFIFQFLLLNIEADWTNLMAKPMQSWVTFGAQLKIFQMPLKVIFVLFPYIVANVVISIIYSVF